MRAATAPFVDASRYFTDGGDRPPFYGAWQPRVGFSYDLTGAGPPRRLRRLRPLLRPHLLQRRARREVPAAVGASARSGSRSTARRATASRRSSGAGVPEQGGPRRPDRQRRRAESRSVPHRQRHPAAASAISSTSASDPASAAILFTANYAGIRASNGMTFLFGNRRPDGSCCRRHPRLQQHPHLERREEELVRRALPDRGAPVRRSLGIPRHLHAREGGRDRRRSLQPRLPLGRGLSPPSDRRPTSGTASSLTRHLRPAGRLHRQHVHDARRPGWGSPSPTTRRDRASISTRFCCNAGRPPRYLQLQERRSAGARRSSAAAGGRRRRSRSRASTSSTRRTSAATTATSRCCRARTRTSAQPRARSTTAAAACSSACGIRSR